MTSTLPAHDTVSRVTELPPELMRPLYTVTEASRILRLPTATLANWARGYDSFTSSGAHVVGAPLVTNFGRARRHVPTLPFVGLAEAAFLTAVRSTGVPMQRIRPALDRLKQEIGLEHALASEMLFTDGAELLINRPGSDDDARTLRNLVVARNNQGVFVPVIEGFLRHISYGPSGYAEALALQQYGNAGVTVDPSVAFGMPFLSSNGVQVDAILDRFDAGESIGELADDFEVTRAVVESLIRASLKVAA